MSGPKLARTIQAVQFLVGHLSPDDRLSITIFDSHVDTILRPQRVVNKDEIRALASTLTPGSSTNLSGGWLKGLELTSANASPALLSAVILMTDGLANVGITDPDTLASVGAEACRERGIRTTALGFGADFNEDLLKRIAESSSGRFFFVESADHAPAIFAAELEGLLKIAAQNIEVRLRTGPEVNLIAQWTGYPAATERESIAFRLGDAYAGEEKILLLGLHVPGLRDLGPARIADIELTYAEIAENEVIARRITEPVSVNVADAEEAAKTRPAEEVLLHLGLQKAAKAKANAVKAADEGDFAGSIACLREVHSHLSQGPVCNHPLVKEELADLAARERDLEVPEMYASTRKSMVESSCFTATSNYHVLSEQRKRRRSRSS
jgi:Ca-activated chloride channel family protein